MTRTVVGLFRDANESQAALHDLEAAGFTREHVNLVSYDGSGQYSEYLGEGSELGSNTAKGAAAGGVAGLLLGLAAVALPGIGPIIAAGPIAAALAGAGVGAATGGIFGALADMGVPGHEAKYYEEGIRRGGTLVIVRAEDEERSERAQAVLDRHGALDIEHAASSWDSDDREKRTVPADSPDYGDEGSSSQWTPSGRTATTPRGGARVYPGGPSELL